MIIQPIASNAITLTLYNGDKYEIHGGHDGRLFVGSGEVNGKRPIFSIFDGLYRVSDAKPITKSKYISIERVKEVDK